MTCLGSNKPPRAISRIGKAIGLIQEVLQNFDDTVLYECPPGKHHIASSEKDRDKIIGVLLTVLDEHKTRSHSCFPRFKSLFQNLNKTNLKQWITQHFES